MGRLRRYFRRLLDAILLYEEGRELGDETIAFFVDLPDRGRQILDELQEGTKEAVLRNFGDTDQAEAVADEIRTLAAAKIAPLEETAQGLAKDWTEYIREVRSLDD